MKTQCIVLIAFGFGLAAASNSEITVSPIEKVIELLDDLIQTVQSEAKEEATVYDEFACFCKDNTKKKSDLIEKGQTTIDEESATIAENTAGLAEKEDELADLIKQIDALTTEMAEARAQREKEAAEAAKVIADLEFACESLAKAIEALEASKPAELIEIKKVIRRSLALAEVLGMDMGPKRKRAINALLQVDQPEAPEGDYEFHSQGIIDILKDLDTKFNEDREEKITEEEKAKKAHEDLMEEKEEAKKTAEEGRDKAKEAIADHKAKIAEAKQSLTDAEAALKDDQLYLKDLTERCELKAREWDQRSTARADELTALQAALKVIKGGAQEVEAARALLLEKGGSVVTPAVETSKVISVHRPLNDMEDDLGDLNLAFLQKSQSPRSRVVTLLQKVRAGDASADATRLEQHKQQALSFLASEGKRLGSDMLIATAIKLGPDPFKKVKVLIQQLIERLLQEMAAEAGHKGFCDTELGKARTTRDFEHEKTQKLSADLEMLEVKKEQLEEAIKTLAAELEDLGVALDKTTKQRSDEKEENAMTVKDSEQGLAAIKEAIAILKEFYKNAAKNKVSLIQTAVSPIDEEGGVGEGGQSQGAYGGKQTAANGIISMLEVIKSDFERSIKQTSEADAEAHRAFIQFDRQSKGSISQKETAHKQSEADLKETKIKTVDAMQDLKDSQSILDDALKAYEELKPQCIDTGMSYEERVAAREKEIEALKKALCQLDPENVEPECA
jgi:hypothetical protein